MGEGGGGWKRVEEGGRGWRMGKGGGGWEIRGGGWERVKEGGRGGIKRVEEEGGQKKE